jgi:signal transduction histidine kinase
VGFNGASSRTFTTVADLNRDGKLELIVSRLRSQGDESSPNLLLLDPATGRELDQKTVRPGLGKCLLCNPGPRGRPLVLCPAQDNTLYCLDDRFNERWRTGGGGTNILAVIGIGNLDGRGDPEILVANYSGISVLDVDGRVLADVAASGPVEGSALAVVGGRRVAVFSAGGLVRVAQLRRPDVSPVGLTTIAGSAAALLIGLMVWIRTRARRVMGVSDRTTELLDAMIAFGHGGGSLRVIDRLRFHLQNWKRWAGSSSPSAATFAELCETYTRAVLPDLLSVASLARRSGVARDTWRSLEENARRADADVRSLVTNSKSEDRVARATSHLVEVDRCLQEVRGHLRRMFSTPLQPLLEQVLARRRADFQTMGVTVSVTGLVERYPSVFVSDVALDKILDGLVSNALAAMARSSERRLAVEVASEGDHYTIDVGDTGCGIAEENWERVFDRDYTTKEGGGFGLYYARHETARFGGKIYVLKSAVGAGTTMRVILRSA